MLLVLFKNKITIVYRRGFQSPTSLSLDLYPSHLYKPPPVPEAFASTSEAFPEVGANLASSQNVQDKRNTQYGILVPTESTTRDPKAWPFRISH